jgi:vacuolar protein sorting-associated protein 8
VQVVRLCREHGLYGALIYLFNQGLNDFRTPLEELLSVVQNTNSKDDASSGYEIFWLAADL